jgi:hypothetical protein
VLDLQFTDRRKPVHTVAFERVAFDYKDAGGHARHDGDIGVRPLAEILTDDLGVVRLTSFRSAELLRLMRPLGSGRRREDFPAHRGVFEGGRQHRSIRIVHVHDHTVGFDGMAGHATARSAALT